MQYFLLMLEFMNSKCQNFFRGGYASAGIPLEPNMEYPEVIRVHVNNDRHESSKK